MATGFNVRVGDADRDAVAAQLREHYADGRLTLDELNERLDQAFAAKTRADLDLVMRDLPHAGWPTAGLPAGGLSNTAWQGPARSAGSGWYSGNSRQGRPCGAFAPLMGLVWVFVILGAVMLFGVGGDRPLAIVLIIAAIAFIRRLFGLGGRRRGGGPKGPRGPGDPGDLAFRSFEKAAWLAVPAASAGGAATDCPHPGSAPGPADLSLR